jgi:hypothetical protein
MFLQSLAVNKNRSRGLFCYEWFVFENNPDSCKNSPQMDTDFYRLHRTRSSNL